MPAFRPTPLALRAQPNFNPHVGRITPSTFVKWGPTLALWGGAGAGAVMLFMSNVPIFKHDVLIKMPFIASYFEDKTHPADNAF
ncbi:uncharacterized protein PFL1_02238 [Pseudozyma flocculosa PF-1]|uniref:Related to QCR10 - ubiquinol--cytochrome-c reductase 8.5 kDa subunit n=1 Tax=Pseudozyma flocculosa TaxID=84751 RepID=A0A5C3FDT4_9BASI|nr:uncharacterized protein PFL1_02238 [Pseudozyma flocculosa PF-1]EPQ30121.1 hypothetical protein PFL1_02238 [Pseudozyma flocculosa PF-1]SPO42266.1 related to QCR10 - ubiquinol--cytochrome-c reductase 8.5 kDa subunit [Pseudozyma flocculosa]